MGRKPTRWWHLPPRMRARERGKTIYYFYEKGGKPRVEVPLGTDYPAAVKKWAELEQEKLPAFGRPTFMDAVNRYLIEILPTKDISTQRINLRELESLKEFFGNPPAPLDEIQPIHIRQFLDWRVLKAKRQSIEKNQQRSEAGKPTEPIPHNYGHVRANREKALFSHIFNFAREKGMTASANPCAGITSYKETGRDIYIEDDLYQRVYEHASAPLQEAMDLAYLTGQRPADVLGYTLSDIKDSWIEVTQAKTKKKVRVSIEGELSALIERIRQRRMTLKVTSLALLVSENGQRLTAAMLRGRFDAARQKAGIEKDLFQFRDLRAKAGTDKAEMGDILAARDQLGHTKVAMTEHYIRNRRGKLVKPTK